MVGTVASFIQSQRSSSVCSCPHYSDSASGAYIGKRYIKLDRPMVPRVVQQQQLSAEAAAVGADGKRVKLTRPAGCRTVFVKNLPYECEEADVSESFMVCGKISKVSTVQLVDDISTVGNFVHAG